MSNDTGIGRRRLLAGAATLTGGALLAPALARPALAGQPRSAPRVHPRLDWQARAPKAAATVLPTGPDHIVVHHTASENATDYSLEHAYELSRSIQKAHMDDNGWDDIGEQLTISRGGHLMEGRNLSLDAIANRQHVVGAHTLGHNSHTIGIENEGTYMTETPTPRLLVQLTLTCAWLCRTYDLNPHDAIVGHRDYNNTACPGDRLYALLPKLRTAVAAILSLPRPEHENRPHNDGPRPGPKRRFDHGPALERSSRIR
ncbi:peptidoglycan recognition protein family protein [Actinomadura rubrisoli]|uniref:N-acetylmuramoyl-L-alanine amidase n=1 Tax=Actinomadura rubrisoli TaxID=2530368 RepID=A0A4R5BGE4_9ACTN|nr:peptidoglycan recognition family protein [Actinomadura rubrisoli]TDD82772.1 N-acetylmuramoyl-L-alanine amidase [Actinomadura rubrisoli]